MKILIAPDSFKGSLTALEVAEHLAKGLQKANYSFKIVKFPMADGGEGTVESLVAATGGKIVKTIVTGPLGEKISGFYGILPDGKTAVIEMAAASGLPLVPEKMRNPLKTTTYGTGELIRDGLNQGCREFIIGIGGSATNDCGMGVAQALGVRFLDGSGNEVGYGGGKMIHVERIDLSKRDPRILDSKFLVACDVDNPLYGETGAAYIYGPQKGATPKMVKELDQGLRHIAEVIKRDLNKTVDELKGAGAAGGLGAGLVAFLNAELRPGIEIVLKASQIEEELKNCDLVITGEGRIDRQTIFGKTPIGIARIAKKYLLPVIGVTGSVGEGAFKVYDHGIDALFSIVNSPMTLQAAVENSGVLLEELGENIGRIFNIAHRRVSG